MNIATVMQHQYVDFDHLTRFAGAVDRVCEAADTPSVAAALYLLTGNVELWSMVGEICLTSDFNWVGMFEAVTLANHDTLIHLAAAIYHDDTDDDSGLAVARLWRDLSPEDMHLATEAMTVRHKLTAPAA